MEKLGDHIVETKKNKENLALRLLVINFH